MAMKQTDWLDEIITIGDYSLRYSPPRYYILDSYYGSKIDYNKIAQLIDGSYYASLVRKGHKTFELPTGRDVFGYCKTLDGACDFLLESAYPECKLLDLSGVIYARNRVVSITYAADQVHVDVTIGLMHDITYNLDNWLTIELSKSQQYVTGQIKNKESNKLILQTNGYLYYGKKSRLPVD